MATSALSTMFAVRPHNLVPVNPASPDAELLYAWNNRQTTLAKIESKGRFYDSEEHSPSETATYDQLVAQIISKSAKTIEGVQVKLWDAISHVGSVTTDACRDRHDTLRRADFKAALEFAKDMDCEEVAMLQIIADLAELTKSPVFGAVDL